MRTSSATTTICAPATAPGPGAVAMIRVSGPQAIAIVAKRFVPFDPSRALTGLAGYEVAVGDYGGLDRVVATVFRAPHSYTGEDVVELSCHGGVAVKRALLAALLADGAVLAGPGAFSRRAFINGKLDLVQAEAVAALIAAESDRQANAAYRQLMGVLSTRLRAVTDALYQAMATLELILEFPEHDDVSPEALTAMVRRVRDDAQALAETHRRGHLLQGGARVVISGRPNVGKSSLLNALSGVARAIVTETAGTTRDTIEMTLDIEGYKVILIDTAGVRETSDPIEKEGVRRSEEALAGADVALLLTLGEPTADVWQTAVDIASRGDAAIVIQGQADRVPDRRAAERALARERARLASEARVATMTYSAWIQKDQQRLKEALVAALDAGETGDDQVLISTERQAQALNHAVTQLDATLDDLTRHVPLDLVASRLHHAAQALASVTGDDVTDNVIDTLFSRFCIGK